MITPIIISGGSGTRLWPLSRKLCPKQFLSLIDEETLFCKTLKRVWNRDIFTPPTIIANQDHRFMIADELKSLGVKSGNIILEPQARNTAPAITIGAIDVLRNIRNDEDDIMLIMPCDHLIKDVDGFVNAILEGEKLAKQGYMVTFGIKPKKAETGFGYIKSAQKIEGSADAHLVERFIEKPDLKKATEFVSDTKCRYFFNSGIFMFSAAKYLEEIGKYESEIVKYCHNSYDKAQKYSDNGCNYSRIDNDEFEKCRDISIDYAVMERAENIAMIPVDVGWSDVGNWDALHEVLNRDENRNSVSGDVIVKNVENCHLRSKEGLMVAVGVKDIIAVQTKDVTLLVHKDSTQDIKNVVEDLRAARRTEHLSHPRVERPWGSFEVLESSNSFKVKRLTIKPGGVLSLQLHKHRAEHWTVVRGTATVTCADKEFELKADESTYIPQNTKHRLCNNGDEDLEVIETQTGKYLGEDDIIRFEDVYGRILQT